MEANQLDLFADIALPKSACKPESLCMDAEALVRWKTKIAAHQQRTKENQLVQGTLFDVAKAHIDPDKIDPFNLCIHPMSFYRLPVDSPGAACIYFVLDSAVELILYIGETCRSNKRWQGTHDCKRYLDNYQSLHYQHGLSSAINMAFWWDAPVQTKPRQQLELSLIQKWQPPFNKENWQRWSQPFR
ncbi:hypothetical protein UH38_18850 [Aliterella atlantica CENA595]|uniref:GIY-YIG domain-containing protein n=1 Tax=Aliterella atlantica CENA595 TaxID=1618023 RepID=A0A0D8ZNA6_9CYAN|nr:hypothetical protein UH38_18850 [Aliterella atlantica CENA595]